MFSLPGEPSLVTEARQHILESFSDLEFYPDGHRYVLNGQELPSVSNVVHRFIRTPFDDQRQAIRYAERHGQTPEYWIQQWRQNAFRAQTLGTKTHAYGESLGYLRAGMPERICPSILPQYMPEYRFLAPIHPKEEAVLQERRDACAAKIDARTMSAYERIRKSVHNHLAVVSVYNGNACGGCFNTITPQRLVEVASNRKLIICEHCGRIIINPDFE